MGQFQISNTREKLEKSSQSQNQNVEMFHSRIVPLTRKGFFWDDPFFTNVWEDFEKLRSDIWKGNQDFFSRFQQTRQDQQVNSLQHSRNLTFNRNSFESDPDFGLSRRWLMPKGIFDEDSANFQLKDQVLRVKDDENKFEVSIDTHGFKPEDLQVRVQNNIVSISAKHEEKTSESNSKSYSSRQLSKCFTLPQGCKMDTVSSHLSKDGLLIISAPKPNANGQGAPRKIQIQTGPLDGGRTAPEENNSAPRYRLVGSKLVKPKFIDY